MYRMAVVVCAAVLLTACSNQVYSDAPLMAADEPLTESVRSGRWMILGDTCEDRQPPVAWTECGDVMLVADGAIYLDPLPDPARMAGGDPLLIEAKVAGERLTGKALDDFALAQRGKLPPRTGEAPVFYSYSIVEPLRRDAEGRVVMARRLDVQCGPRPKDGLLEATPDPFPTITMDAENLNCTVASRSDLEDAARRSMALPRSNDERYVWVGELTAEDRQRIAQSTIAE